MNAVLILAIGIAVLLAGYIFYGKWLSEQWGVDDTRETPAHTMRDDVDYVPAKIPVVLGHHFSSIAGAGPINGPIQAAVFGWVPVTLWILIGGIFVGAAHDFGALFASLRHKGQSIGEVISANIGQRAQKLFIVFAYLSLILVVAAFTSIVAGTFNGINADGSLNETNAAVATISILFIVMAVIFGFFVYRKGVPLSIATVIGVLALAACLAVGLHWHPIYLPSSTWMWIVGGYILVASVTPVWMLLQPRDYLSSFLLYGMMLIAIVGVFGAGITGHNLNMDIPAFTGFKDPITNRGYLFPALFVTIACGAISGFHSLISSGTTSKQLNRERDALPIAFGGMMIECALALISLCAVGFIWAEYTAGDIRVPTQVFAEGLSRMVACIPGLEATHTTVSALLILTVSAFCLTSLDTATRLARYMFQEFWLRPGETYKDVSDFRKVLCSPFVSTIITVVLGVSLGMGGYDIIWPLFGAANQLLAVLALLAVASWLGNIGRNNKMFLLPMAFMLMVTLTSLGFTMHSEFLAIGTAGTAAIIRFVIAALLFVLALVLVKEGVQTLFKKTA